MDSVTLITGTKEDNVLAGTIGTDILLGKGGDDLVNGGAGNDLLVGGKGDDELNGGAGNDLLLGGNGDDQLDGGAGNDLLDGGNGDDLLDGGAGNDLLDGGNGDDLLDGGAGSDIVLGGKGDDTANYIVSANFGARDSYDGGKGYDTLQLMLTSAELKIAQADITAFQAFLEGSGKIFHFHSFDLTVRNFEALEIHLVDGNVAPVASGNTYEAVEDVALVIQGPGVLDNDNDAEGAALSAMLVTGPTNGTVTLNGDGSFNYTPHANFFGEDSFTYKANDGALDSNVATVKLQVAAVNDKPVATDDTFRTDEDVALNGNVLGNDVDVDNDVLSAKLVDGPKNGTLAFNTDGSFSYAPDADYFGDDFFTYRASDGALESSPATVKLSINAVNDAPVAVNDEIAGTAGGAGAIRVAVVGGGGSNYEGAAKQLDGSSTDFEFAADSILVTTFATKAEWLTKLANYDVVVVGENGLSVSDYDGSQLFGALRDFVDAGGGVVTTGWFAGEIAAYSDAAIRADADYISPAASSPDSLYTRAGSSISVLDASHPIAGGIDGYAVQGYVHELAGAVDASATVLANGGASALAAIAYDEVGTNGGLTVYLGSLHMANAAFASDATGHGTVDQIFEQAVAWAAGEQEKGTASTDEDTPLLIDDALLLGNDSDVEGNALALVSVSAKSKLGAAVSINAHGDIVYDPTAALQGLAAGELASDSFWYEVSDGKGGTDTATANVTVAGLADAALGDTGDAGLSLGLGTPDADMLL